MINVNEILEKLTLEEKVCLLSGHKSWHTNKVSRVGLPAIFLTDGPHGLRKQGGASDHLGINASVPATAFPTATRLRWGRILSSAAPTR